MSLIKEESVELSSNFIRNSTSRKSFRVRRHRYNSKIPPAAILYMKSLEKCCVNEINTTVKTSHVVIHPKCDNKSSKKLEKLKNLSKLTEIVELDDSISIDDTVPLLRRTSSRSSFKKSTRKYKKLNKLISIFK